MFSQPRYQMPFCLTNADLYHPDIETCRQHLKAMIKGMDGKGEVNTILTSTQ